MHDRTKTAAKKPKAEEFKTAQARKSKFNNHSSSLDQILFLQRTIGNQAVERMIRNVHSPSSVVREQIQAKLKIGQPNDIYEQEADRVAEQIVSSSWSVVNNQREEGGIQRQTEEEERKKEEETLQLKEMQGNIPEVTPDLESRIRALRGGSQPLPKSIRAFFEPRFGYDFSQVRIHNDPEGAKLARALNARAFTVGRHIVFGAGEYSPQTLVGKRLLAHELTHVVQQTGKLTIGQSRESGISTITSQHEFRIRKTPDPTSEYDQDDYRGAIVDTLHKLVIRHHRAVSNFKSTLQTETFDAGTAASIIVGKGIGCALGFVPRVGPVLSTLWDMGRDIYQQSVRAAASSSVNQFCQRCLDMLDDFEKNQETRISNLTRQYNDELSTKQGTERQSYMDNARRRNIEGYKRVPEARTIEGDLYEAYLTARTRGGAIAEFLGIETKGRIELEYEGTFASPPYRLDSASVKDTGNDSEVNRRLNDLHNNRVNIHEMSSPKRLYAPHHMGGKTYMDFHPDNSIETYNPMVDVFCWRQTMNSRFPTVRLG